jgi:twitching motility protein PilT
MHTKLKELLSLALTNKASDIHLMCGVVPKIRISGDLISAPNWTKEEDQLIIEMIESLLTEEQKQTLKVNKELDFSFDAIDARFRANAYWQKETLACALRIISSTIPTFEELNLPDSLKSFVKQKQGFVLITGPTGHGKSTTAACILNQINAERNSHIVTIEDPVEYLIKPKKSIISQRELGGDTRDFNAALRSCLRQDPNVVFIGEMRDLESIQLALTIAETGHLVFSSLHTNSASQTIDRIVDVFPANAQDQIRVQLASVFTAIISQRLIPAIGGGRVPAFEILLSNSAVKNIIREGKSFMLDNVIQTSADVGMISLDSYLAQLVLAGKVTEDEAKNYVVNMVDFQSKLRKNKVII